MASSNGVPKLKLIKGGLEESPNQKVLKTLDLHSSIRPGSVVELFGPSRMNCLLQFLKLHPEFKIYWAEREPHISLHSLYLQGLDLTKITFGTLGKDMLLPLSQIFQNSSYQFIIAPQRLTELTDLKTLQTLTQKSNAVLFLMGERISPMPQSSLSR